MRVLVLGRYRAGEVVYTAGQELDLRPDEAERLLRDSPGTFAVPDVPEQPAEAIGAEVLPSGEVALDREARGGRRRGG